jgi:signal transduction histidine kinase
VRQLLINAARSIPEGASHRHEIRVITRTDADGRAVAEVIDTAPPIPPHSLGQLFEPFCTRQVRPGAGLDLFLCQRIVRGMGGVLEVDSTRGLGNVFRIVLPAAGADGATEATPAPAVRARPSSRRSESVRKRMGGGLR